MKTTQDVSVSLYLLTQRDHLGYDAYDSMVVAAYDDNQARHTHPAIRPDSKVTDWKDYDCWARSPESVQVRYLGVATEGIQPGILCASFNAG
jgi:hypothetical protein